MGPRPVGRGPASCLHADIVYSRSILLSVAMYCGTALSVWPNTMENAAPPPMPSVATLQSTYGKLPLCFEVNHGQWSAAAQFIMRGSRHTLFLTPNEAVLSVRTGEAKDEGQTRDDSRHQLLRSPSSGSQPVVRMKFTGADAKAEMVGLEPLPGTVNYFILKTAVEIVENEQPVPWPTS